MRGVKADKATYESRVNIVLTLIYRGWPSGRIVQNITELWHIQERQARNYIRAAYRRIRKLYEQKQKNLIAEMLARHDDLRDRAYQDHNLSLVLDIDKEDAKLLGLYAPEKHQDKVTIRILYGDDDNDAPPSFLDDEGGNAP